MKNITYLLIFIPVLLFCQGEPNTWYFGLNAGLDFNNGAPEVLSDGQLATFEGCATMSSEEGDLLFYTDGVTVYNRNHQIMQNGLGLSGNFSSTHSAIIFPKPEDLNKYYIFTIDSDGGPKGLQYSVVDMDLDNGLGGITSTKNIFLFGPTNESLAAVENFTDTGFWVIAHKYLSNEFIAFEVTASGVNTTPVVSAIGTETGVSNIIGQMKISPGGNRLAIARKEEIEIFDFNNSTGELSDVLTMNGRFNFYGVEFSQDGSLLYASAFSGGDFSEGVVLQYNLLAGETADEIRALRVVLKLTPNEGFGALQLGPDGRIYVARISSPFLDVIDNPTTLGFGCNYISDAVSLGEGTSIFGLPTFIPSYFRLGIQAENICEGDVTQFYSNIEEAYDSILWEFGNGNTSTEVNPTYAFNGPGVYPVSLTITLGTESTTDTKTITIYEPPEASPVTIVQCEGEGGNGSSVFSFNNYAENILVSIPEQMRSFTSLRFFEDEFLSTEINANSYSNISNPQIIYAELTNAVSGCTAVTEVTLQVSPGELNEITLSNCVDVSANGRAEFNLTLARNGLLNGAPEDASFQFFNTFNEALLENEPLTTTFINTIPYGQTIYARVKTEIGCYGIFRINLNVYEIPNIIEDEELFYCLNDFPNTLTLDSGLIGNDPGNYLYNWSTGAVTQEIEVNQPGTYSVIVSSPEGCVAERIVEVLPSNIAALENIIVEDMSTDNSITVVVSGEGEYEYALENINGAYQESNTFQNVSAGIYTVYVRDIKNDCGIVSENVSVLGYPKFFTPNGDGSNDTWEIKGFSSRFPITSEVKIYNRYGKLITQLNEDNPSWDGTFNGALLYSDDYWFVASLLDGRVIRGHFTLKR